MRFKVVDEIHEITRKDVIYLKYIHYDDYGYCTSFASYYYSNELIELGYLKIGHKNMSSLIDPGTSQNGYNSYSIKKLIPSGFFEELASTFFSLGENISYYKKINEVFNDASDTFYRSIRDLAYDFQSFQDFYSRREPSLISSLMRSIHYANVEQFNRIVNGEFELTDYNFVFTYQGQKIEINVIPNSLPPSNIHVLIGRNGVGKTWLLYHMVYSILNNMSLDMSNINSDKYKISEEFQSSIESNTFTGIISVSFSVFDDGFSSINFNESSAQEISNEELQRKSQRKDDFNKKFKYIGLVDKNQKNGRAKVKSVEDLADEFKVVIDKIKKSSEKKKSYLEMCEQLNTDSMFNDNGFIDLLNRFFLDKEKSEEVIKNFKWLSSGHMIIMLSLTLLCESIFEKTIVLIDEPETHLHPPLLSTYIRTLSYLLRKKNAVAIIATHSPIVVQEVPSNCVTKIERIQRDMCFSRPDIESFASNTDSLTREIFGYEVIKTGFYKLLEEEIEESFEETYKKFDERIGFLGQILIQRLTKKRGDVQDEEN
ncbi:AAA family ATPase [Desulfitobacterium hafniense]|nr:AAA family ATPase [Desulfitobacterium hafniense]